MRFIVDVANPIVLLNFRSGELSDVVDTINIPITGTNKSDRSNIIIKDNKNKFSSVVDCVKQDRSLYTSTNLVTIHLLLYFCLGWSCFICEIIDYIFINFSVDFKCRQLETRQVHTIFQDCDEILAFRRVYSN